ncbi:nucleolar pre-ribosomal-associated protein 1-like [Chamaea fasciata]|uniref:nucleolar pre-ribosomal-associated protein 1-like n=1 Tax=Chamaea fasciata TaxID=190680 RepID=UPI00336A7A8B
MTPDNSAGAGPREHHPARAAISPGRCRSRSARPCLREQRRFRGAAFDGARLTALLRDPAAAAKGLETFVSVARTLPSAQVYDVVERSVKISMECAEIFKLLDGERKPESEMLLVFQALEAILLRTASDRSHLWE